MNLWNEWRTLKAVLKTTRDLLRMKKEMENSPMSKPLGKSMTVWGAVIAGVGGVLVLFGEQFAAGVIDWGALLPRLVEVVGLVLAAIGARRAIGTITTGQ